jgi:hypothetical protein
VPGSVTNASYTGTLPWSLSTHFVENQEWKALVSEYKDGRSQRAEQVSTSRKTYSLDKRLAPAAMATLRAFYMSHIGIAFRVYLAKVDYDASNASFKICRFEGGWSEEFTLGRSNVSLQVVEVA